MFVKINLLPDNLNKDRDVKVATLNNLIEIQKMKGVGGRQEGNRVRLSPPCKIPSFYKDQSQFSNAAPL